MRKIIIGVTGGFGTGKTTVAKIFAMLGGELLDADSIAHEVMMPGRGVYKKVVTLFGSGILKKNGQIDRTRLARIVFKDKKKRASLNSLVHPEVMKKIKKAIKRSPKEIFILDVPLLIETGMHKRVDKVVVVTAGLEAQVSRCAKKTGLSRIEIMMRVRSQMELSKKKRLADFIIDNSGPLKSTRKKAVKIWRGIERWQKRQE